MNKTIHFIYSKKYFILLLLIIAIGSFLRFYQLTEDSLWYDEVLAASASLKDVKYILKGQYTLHPPLYYLTTHFSLLIQKSDYFARIPAVLFGILSIWMVYNCGMKLFGCKEGLIAAFLISINTMQITYSQEARMYTQLVFLSMLTLFFTLKILENKSFKNFFLFLVFTVLNLYTHYSAIMVLGIELPFVIFSLFYKERKWKFVLYFITSLLLLFILYLPQIYKIVSISDRYIGGNMPFSRQVFGELYDPSAFIGFKVRGEFFLNSMIFFMSVAIICSLKNKLKETLLATWWVIAPFIFISNIKIKHFFVYRYIIFINPMLIILLARGISLTSDYAAKITDIGLIKKLINWYIKDE